MSGVAPALLVGYRNHVGCSIFSEYKLAILVNLLLEFPPREKLDNILNNEVRRIAVLEIFQHIPGKAPAVGIS